MKKTKVLIIGSGPAGYTAAIYAARAALNPIQVTGLTPGGQLTGTTDVENFPGFEKAIQGPWLMEQMQKQALAVGTEMIHEMVAKIDFSQPPFKAWTDEGTLIEADAVIIATGATANWLNLESEERFKGYGVSACATCDGFFYKNKHVAVVGGGNSAVEEAIYLTNHAARVTLIHRRDGLRAEKVLQERLFSNPKIDVIWDTSVVEVLGEEQPRSMTGLRLKNTKDGTESTFDVDGLFIAIGHSPQTSLFKDVIDCDQEGYVLAKQNSTQTSIPGVFAAGESA